MSERPRRILLNAIGGAALFGLTIAGACSSPESQQPQSSSASSSPSPDRSPATITPTAMLSFRKLSPEVPYTATPQIAERQAPTRTVQAIIRTAIAATTTAKQRPVLSPAPLNRIR